jgi:hypothetical protein
MATQNNGATDAASSEIQGCPQGIAGNASIAEFQQHEVLIHLDLSGG